MESHDHDVVVVGAGFAGAAASIELGRLNVRTLILEARDRVGGRAYARPFAAGGETLEFGGAWITPWHERIRRHAAENGIELRPTHAVTEHRMHDGLVLRTGTPCAPPAEAAYWRTMERIRTDAANYQSGERNTAVISFNTYLDGIHASPEARAQACAWWTISGNGDPDRISAAEFLASCAYGGGRPEGMMTALRHTLTPSAPALVERMIARSGAALKLGVAVARIEHAGGGVRVTVGQGEQFSARSAIVCLPLNALPTIEFVPPLRPRQRIAVETGHGGIAIKLWIAAESVPAGILATGGGSGVQWMFAERAGKDGLALIVAFALDDGSFEPRSRNDVAEALHRFFPEARLVAWDWHDWIADPWARGTWVAAPADAPWIADSREWLPHGRVWFAGSDISHESPGWFEAAIASGEAAARAAAELVDR
jgi:monoamine oxidase